MSWLDRVKLPYKTLQDKIYTLKFSVATSVKRWHLFHMLKQLFGLGAPDHKSLERFRNIPVFEGSHSARTPASN